MVKENSTSIDMISNLPIEILCHILSFLPIKQAFSTTILSKRWTSLYKLLTHLHFDDESVSDEDAFLRYVSFVNTVMLSTELIKTFHIKYGSTHWQRVRNFNLIDSLIQTAKQHPVENLQLFSPLIGINLPPTIFSFPTLVVLKLTKFRITCNINISVIDLPSLKTLHLIGVSFKDEENFNKLLYGCPVLEDLVVFIFCIERFENASVVNTREFKPLSSLIRASIDETYVPLTALYNVQNLELEVR
ncbi:FBD-associated F-box protein At3g52670-like [Vicia villosa]|uniref:FBD-associated F-box protein At3g52670-like n=1 Tax=Vicia villosa TaxID=3911 RepID=UPI00273CCFEC|nr:FBD-associated F-box protein At3g52670-like [Vicia villosa]